MQPNEMTLQKCEWWLRALMNKSAIIQSNPQSFVENALTFGEMLNQFKKLVADSEIEDIVKADVRKLYIEAFSENEVAAFVDQCRKIVYHTYNLRVG